MDIRLDNKRALITGGSRGIGRQIAMVFASSGAQVMISSRKADACEQAASEIGEGCVWEAGNAGDPEDAERIVDACIDRLGGVDILVNGAGTNPYMGPLIDIDLSRWDKTMSVNVTGPLVWTQQVWRKWMSEHGGVIINLSSVGAMAPNRNLGGYDISKAALVHMTRHMAAELGPGVRVNALCPGVVRTDFARKMWDGPVGEESVQLLPLKRFGEVEDVANAALFLAADASSWITGEAIVLDGGGLVSFDARAIEARD